MKWCKGWKSELNAGKGARTGKPSIYDVTDLVVVKMLSNLEVLTDQMLGGQEQR